jgi:hypothetical protein
MSILTFAEQKEFDEESNERETRNGHGSYHVGYCCQS